MGHRRAGSGSPLRYLTGVGGPDLVPYRSHPRLGLLAQPRSYGADEVGAWAVWAADNGCYALRGAPFVRDRWVRWLDGLPRGSCLWAASPDVLHWDGPVCTGDAAATLEWAQEYLPLIRSMGFRAALVLQDGMTTDLPWSAMDAVFVGGSTGFKLGPGAQTIITEAVLRGLPAHMGRVNSHRRIALAAALGCESADGTFLRTAVRTNIPKMLKWFTMLDQGVQGVLPASKCLETTDSPS
jgi:hypothetical protein